MQFLVLGYDGTDEGAKERRAKAHNAHVEMFKKLMADGNLWYAAAMNDSKGNVMGSICIVDFPNKEMLLEWLKTEPYKTGGVWKKVEVTSCTARDPWRFNRPKGFFEGRE